MAGRCYISGSRNGAIGFGEKVYIKVRSGIYPWVQWLGLSVGSFLHRVQKSIAGMVSVRWRLEITIVHRECHAMLYFAR